MALPTSMVVTRDPIKRTGIVLGVFGSTQPNTELEVWRSTQTASTASTLWSITRYPPTTLAAYTIPYELPLSTRYHNFKARSQAIGFQASAFTAIVRAKPVVFSKYPTSPNVPTNNSGAIEIPNPIFMNANQTMFVGAPSQVTPTTFLEKTLTIHPAQFVPADYGQQWNYTALRLAASSTNGATLFANVALPAGVVATSVSARVFRTSTNDRWDLSFVRRTSADGTSLLLELRSTANTSTGWYTAGGVLAHTWTTNGYSIQADLNPLALANDSLLGWVRIRYRMPTYARAI